MKLRNGKKIVLLLFIIFVLWSSTFCSFATSATPSLVSQAAILMDNKTNKILYQKNEMEKMYPASTTKIMTAILTLENCNLDEIVTVSYDAIMDIPEGYSSASLQINEQLTVEQLLQLLLVHSANDAANSLAEHVGGSIESFVSMMNTKAHEIGLNNTHFTNSYGLHDENHYTTAYDLAILMQYCMKNEDFRKIAGSASCAIPATNLYGTRNYASTNELIIPTNSNYYSYLTAGKTGYTSQAGDCLVSCAYKDGLELICVILGGKSQNGISTRCTETKLLYEYGYANYSLQTLLNQNDLVTQIEISNGTKESKNLDLLANKSIEVLLENSVSKESLEPKINLNENLKAPIEQGECIGTISYTIDGISYEADLYASHAVEKSKLFNIVLEIGIGLLLIIFIMQTFFHKRKK